MAKTIRELTADLLAAPSACKEVKEAAQNYLDAAGKEGEAAAAKAYVAELEAEFPGRHFTLDGHLVGSIGEVMAAYYYGSESLRRRRGEEHSGPCQRAQGSRCEILRLSGMRSL